MFVAAVIELGKRKRLVLAVHYFHRTVRVPFGRTGTPAHHDAPVQCAAFDNGGTAETGRRLGKEVVAVGREADHAAIDAVIYVERPLVGDGHRIRQAEHRSRIGPENDAFIGLYIDDNRIVDGIVVLVVIVVEGTEPLPVRRNNAAEIVNHVAVAGGNTRLRAELPHLYLLRSRARGNGYHRPALRLRHVVVDRNGETELIFGIPAPRSVALGTPFGRTRPHLDDQRLVSGGPERILRIIQFDIMRFDLSEGLAARQHNGRQQANKDSEVSFHRD